MSVAFCTEVIRSTKEKARKYASIWSGASTGLGDGHGRMTILQNVSVVKSRGMSAILSGEANRLGASIRNSFRRFVPALPACTERCAGDGELVFHGRADSLVHF